MLGKTHMATGVAASLIILHPDTMPGVISAIAGGMVGGWICDLDCRKSEINEGAIAGFIFTAVFGTAILAFDYYVGNGICEYFKHNYGLKSIMGIVILLLCCIYGFCSSHRTFMHSILALVVMTLSVGLFCMPIAPAFGIGVISHLILDITNKRSLQLFFPFKVKVCMNICSSNGKANNIIMWMSLIISVIAGSFLFFKAFSESEIIELKNGILPFFDNFIWYLIGINVFTFIVYCIDYFICACTYIEEDQDFVHTIMNILPIAGGAYGMLLSFIVLRQKIEKYNANWYAICFSLVILWSSIIYAVYNPAVMEDIALLDHPLIIAYLILINIISFVVFFKDRVKFRTKWTTSELWLVLLGLMGGTVGGLIVIALTGKKSASPHFAFGFCCMLIAQVAALVICI